MLVLNNVQVLRRTKPVQWWMLTGGSLLFGFLSIWMAIDQGGVTPWICVIFFGSGGLLVAFWGLKPSERYQPGISFKGMRLQNGAIILKYRLAIAAGAIVAVATVVLAWGKGLSYNVLAGGVGGGLSLVSYGYYGLIRKQAHGDVDAVAVDLAHEHGASQRNKVYLSCLNFSAGEQQNKAGHAILLVCADRLVICRYSDNVWQSSEQPFSAIAAMGFSYKREAMSFFNNNSETRIYFEFKNGSTFQVALDPEYILTAEPTTFVRSFLSLLDAWGEMLGSVARSSTPYRKITIDMSHESIGSSEPIELVGQAQDARFAAAAIKGALSLRVPLPRQLEL
jgi:hypothetical protein